MSLATDLLLDRRRLKRRLFTWRLVSLCAVAIAVGTGIRAAGIGVHGRHVARITVNGLITEDRKRNHAVEVLANDDSVAAVILYVDSPGGSLAGGESLHDSLVHVAAAKPTVAVLGGTAASAAYMIATPASRIFAREGTLTGSIGVLLETVELSGLLRTLGVSAEAIASGPLKGQPSFLHPLSAAGRDVLTDLVMNLNELFINMVAHGRNLAIDEVRKLADGRPYTGRQALQLRLIDEIGGEPEAREWLAGEKGVPGDLPTEDVQASSLAERALHAKLGATLEGLLEALVEQALRLDGVLAVGHPLH
jgi:protease IV